jgi:hypothetical protein
MMSASLGLAAALATAPPPRNATAQWGKEPMKLSPTGPQSTLPSFFFMAGSVRPLTRKRTRARRPATRERAARLAPPDDRRDAPSA